MRLLDGRYPLRPNRSAPCRHAKRAGSTWRSAIKNLTYSKRCRLSNGRRRATSLCQTFMAPAVSFLDISNCRNAMFASVVGGTTFARRLSTSGETRQQSCNATVSYTHLRAHETPEHL